jgi:S-adenosylmethionine:tRNA ribosyltransferase-isomerase
MASTDLALSQLNFEYPENLVATERALFSRIMYFDESLGPMEINRGELLSYLRPGDLWVVNETKVLRRRVFTLEGLEILFIKSLNPDRTKWEVLCPSSRWAEGTQQSATIMTGDSSGDRLMKFDIVKRGRPQEIICSEPFTEELFDVMAELPLPPYIQKARGQRHTRWADETQYQSVWAKDPGSLAAPTASFHFDKEFEEAVRTIGVDVVPVTLHVGLGTFLPVTVEHLSQHVMHPEFVIVPRATIEALAKARASGARIFAIGTTVARSLESIGRGYFKEQVNGALEGETTLMIAPGHEWRMVDVLLTNFHQPQSTLLALVAAFSSLENVMTAYRWAIDREFRLFSYGDLNIWSKQSLLPEVKSDAAAEGLSETDPADLSGAGLRRRGTDSKADN